MEYKETKKPKKVKYKTTSFYTFFDKDKLVAEKIFPFFKEKTDSLNLKGIILLADEGINATISGDVNNIETFKSITNDILQSPLFYKDSYSSKLPFKRMKVMLKDEIITFDKNITPDNNNKLSPQKWHEVLKRNSDDNILLDVRNWYETELGTFDKATTLNIDTFQEFLLKFENLKICNKKNVYMFCTGGIRCEKASVALEKKGHKVFQLKGGILNYLNHYPEGFFKGECFVFDHRVSVDGKMSESKKYSLCPHCGQPAKDEYICLQCTKLTKVCSKCIKDSKNQTCSKNCKYHLKKI